MKKFLIIASLLMLPVLASAKGTLSIRSAFDVKTGKEKLTYGLAIYEPLFKSNVAYNSYTGLGDRSINDTGHWYVSKHQLDLRLFNFTLSPGFGVNYLTPEKKYEQEIFLKAALQLW